ncbi:serine/threonine-protein kinase [Chondromyces crocatus]|uniref:Protein kinase domain-containing protein n=1 Tax=Chondromyces crocatus TaxID=52 RepID=A0A0K1ED76_CHOCO|nr:serine/threonine-protein kinase [Chondromyces crocatus]AKT38831.1 uncharacterized protein CMC5_029770 [Chondromyces crocatus]
MRCPHCARRLPARSEAACPVHPDAVAAHAAQTVRLTDTPSTAKVSRAAAAIQAVMAAAAQEEDDTATASEPEPTIPGFQLEALIGEGGFARVHAARRMHDGRAVAIKVARRPGEVRMQREIVALSRLAPPLVPELLGSGRTAGGRPYLVLERLAGRSLADWMASLPGTGSAAPSDALAIVTALGEALDAAHDVGVVHRDVKPENTWMREDGGVTLLDFGLVTGTAALGPKVTRPGEVLGTSIYMAPEQCLGLDTTGPSADVYALGVVTFELLTGRPPFVGAPPIVRRAHVLQSPQAPSSLAPLPSAIDGVVLQCLAKDPLERPRRASELGPQLRTALHGWFENQSGRRAWAQAGT